MSALELILKNYKGTEISALIGNGFGSTRNDLDCNCEDCGSDANCGCDCMD